MSRSGTVSLGWTVALGAAGTLAVLAVLPPLVGGTVGAGIEAAYSALCHQIPERSPHLHGGPIALCHRCSGILAGLIGGIAVVPGLARTVVARIARGAQPLWLLAAVVPTALDWGLGVLGVWANTPASRVVTGAVFGLVAGAVLAANLVTPGPRAATHPAS